MTKYEQLIEFIINEQEDKARELFHQIVVEKSRDIYESLVDEEDLAEVGGNAVEDMVDEITMDEEGMAEDDSEMELSLGDDSDEGEFDMEVGDDDMSADMDGSEGDVEDRVMDLENALDDLKSQFDALMAGEAGEEEHSDMFGGDDQIGGDVEDEEDQEADEMGEMAPVAENKSGRKMTEAEWIREYVEKISAPGNTEGADNKSSVVAGKNDMGGSAKNTAQGGTESDPTGPKSPSNAYSKGQSKLKGAGSFENVPGANAGKAFSTKASASKAEAAGTNDTSVVAK